MTSPSTRSPQHLAARLLTLFLTGAAGGQASPEQADQLWRQREWTKATELYSALVKENPYQGEYWLRLGGGLLIGKRRDEAIAAYQTCLELGFELPTAMRGLGWCYAGKGDIEQAAHWFEQLFAKDPDSIDQMQTDRVKRQMGDRLYALVFGPDLPEDISRVDGWQTDLDYLVKWLFRAHYDINTKTPAEKWAEAIQRLRDAIPNLNDKEVALEFMKLTALAGDSHTCMWPILNRKFGYHMLPLLLFPFHDGFFVRAADAHYSDLVGARVLRIGDRPIEQLSAESSAFAASENRMHTLLNAPHLLGTVEILKMLGATDDESRVSLTVDQGGQTKTVTIASIRSDFDLYGEDNEAPSWVQMNAGEGKPLPLCRQHPNDIYWYEYLEQEQVVYFDYRKVREQPGKPFAAFVDEMFAFIATHPVEALVIDLRSNYGGSSELYRPLLEQIIRQPQINRHGKMFTLIGRSTLSAAMNLSTDLEYWTNTLFVGEPTGCSPNFIGENKYFTLPYSKLRVSVSDRYHQHGASLSTDKRVWIAPDLPAELTSSDYRNGVDPGMAAILLYLKTH